LPAFSVANRHDRSGGENGLMDIAASALKIGSKNGNRQITESMAALIGTR